MALDVVARHTDTAVQLAVRNVPPEALSHVGHAAAVRAGYHLAIGAATTGASVHLRGGPPPRLPRRPADSPPLLPELLQHLEHVGRTVPYRRRSLAAHLPRNISLVTGGRMGVDLYTSLDVV